MPRVSLFVTCIVDQVFPRVGMAMAEVLERAGCEVEFREAQTCCGQPAFNSGYRDEARDVARHFLKVFDSAQYIVVPSGSCASMIAHRYADLFDDHRETRVWEFSSFLVDVLKVDNIHVYEQFRWVRKLGKLPAAGPLKAWLSQRDLPSLPTRSFRELWRERGRS